MLRRFLLSTILATACAFPVAADEGIAGPYLAARLAGYNSDYAEAARAYSTLLARGAATADIAEDAMISFAVLGDFERAAEIARDSLGRFEPMQLRGLVLLIETLRTEDYAAAAALLEAGPVTGPLLDGLLKGWVQLAQGRMSAALDSFDALAEREAFAELASIHRAFALGLVGDFEGAQAIFAGQDGPAPRLGPRGLAAHAEVLVQLDRRDQAIALLDLGISQTNSAELSALRAQIASGAPVRFVTIGSARAGMAEAFFTLAAVVNGQANESFTLIHSRAAKMLDPRHVDAALLSAELFENSKQYGLANEVLGAVPPDHPAYVDAEVARAEILFAGGQEQAAVAALEALNTARPQLLTVLSALGDMNRRLQEFEPARDAYSQAIALLGAPEPRHWFLYYTRAIAHERLGQWEAAEADFQTTLSLQPSQPLVLNYYGYSLVERRERLDEALEMIKGAVEGRPDDGFIADSLGWVYYRLGRFEEAVTPMETAVALEPLDPVINDHLGDVYWKVGRKREAQFQWRRALSFVPEPNDSEADPERIRRKLSVGLTAVLAEETKEQ